MFMPEISLCEASFTSIHKTGEIKSDRSVLCVIIENQNWDKNLLFWTESKNPRLIRTICPNVR